MERTFREPSGAAYRWKRFVRRYLAPRPLVSLYYYLKYRARVSPRAEVELTSNIRFGPDCTVASFCKIKATNGILDVGARSGFATGCFVSVGEGGVEIGEDFACGPNVAIVGRNYVYRKLDVPLSEQGESSTGIRIGRNVWLGANVSVLDGTVLGKNTIVAAGSVLNRRYPANSILQGNPARVLLDRSREASAPPG